MSVLDISYCQVTGMALIAKSLASLCMGLGLFWTHDFTKLQRCDGHSTFLELAKPVLLSCADH